MSRRGACRRRYMLYIIYIGLLSITVHVCLLRNLSEAPNDVKDTDNTHGLLHMYQVLMGEATSDPDYPEQFLSVIRKASYVNCRSVLDGDKLEINRVRNVSKTSIKAAIKDKSYINQTSNSCDGFISNRGYLTYPLSKAEQEFPLAYSILMYKDVEQTERLLRAIYHPQNVYCIHVDRQSKDSVFKAISGITSCFENVFLSPTRFEVLWGTMSVLEPELECMRELWKRHKQWKYFINLTGQEFPLKTNYELVRMLRTYYGRNMVFPSK